VRQVTKSGELYKRNPTWLSPSNRVVIKRCDLLLSEEAARTCEHLRNGARAFVDDVRDHGNIDDIVKRVREWRKGRGF